MKIKHLIDKEAFKNFLDSASAPGFTDAATGVVLARNLTHVDPRIFEKRYPELALMVAGVPVDNIGGYAPEIQSLRVVEEGQFTNSGDRDESKGRISLAGEDSTIQTISREAHSVWSDTDIKQAELQNINLPSRYLQTHTKIYMREVDEIGLRGLAGKNPGLLNYTGFTSTTATDVIENLSAQQMYDEFSTFITDQHNAVNNTPEYMINKIITTVNAINTMTRTMVNTADGFATVLEALRRNHAVEFYGSFRCENVTGSTSATVGFADNDEVLKMRVPIPLRIGTIEKLTSFTYRVDSMYRIAGIDFLENAGGRILTGL